MLRSTYEPQICALGQLVSIEGRVWDTSVYGNTLQVEGPIIRA
jgi:hypothetical protein